MANVINSLKLGDGTYVFTTPYATCDTPSTTVEKVATITPGSNFSLETGARVAVKFTNANTASAPTLNVNSTGAKAIYFKNATITSSLNFWSDGQIVEFIYDGTNWNYSAAVSNTDTKDTTGSSNTSSKIFLVGATSQASFSTTYSHDTVYIDSSSRLTSIYKNTSVDVQNTIRLDPTNQYILVGTGGIGTEPAMYARYGQSSIAFSPNGGTTTYNYSFPTKGGTLAMTSDIPAVEANPTDSGTTTLTKLKVGSTVYTLPSGGGGGDVTLAGNNTFTGSNTFNSILTCPNGINTQYLMNNTNYLYLPNKEGTLAITSDLPDTSSFAKLSAVNEFTKSNFYSKNQIISNNKSLFITNSAFEVIDDQAIETGPTTEIAPNKIELWPVSGAPFSRYMSSEYVNSKVKLFVNTESGKSDKIYFPETTGTLALTKDIPIKSATLSGTTLSITLS